MGKLLAIGVAVAVGAVAYVGHARSASVGQVARCMRHAGSTVRPARASQWASLVQRGDVYELDLDGDRGTLLRLGSGVGPAQVQHALDAAGTDLTDQASGRILVLWRGRPAARSAAALNRCLHL
ncbi:MAG TPA: hypothetical protein VE596_16030 [Gaiellaceae bacterium]|jgi:hypothetical protein|nr:hypothetical protein [Gaiellaceae bacterium]